MSVSTCLYAANGGTRLQPLITPLIPFDVLRMSGFMGQEGSPIVPMLSTAQEEAERHD